MANEYLKRTPTSSGNRKQWTWSAWVKRNQSIRESYFSAGNSTNSSFGIEFDNSSLSSPWIYDYTSGFDWQIKTTQKLRDSGNFFHYLVEYNTTSSTAADRVNVYINGSKISDFSTETYPSVNFEGYVNSLVNHTLGAYITPNFYAKAEFTDIFFIDGQALTPDVFGFHKDGDGYVSAGSTQVTNFRPGQWMPHSPAKIKKDVNRRGGFGVNGFYLPMNDSSNPGADFHCAPNSIITLKGEDLPQPRNGAPTTSDAFVSQLRPEVSTLGFDGCLKLDGNQGLSIADAAALDLGTGDFTIEGFYYLKDEGTYHALFDFRGNGGDGLYPALFKDQTENKLYFYENGVEIDDIPMRYNEWMHVAICRSSGVTRAFVDGKLGGSFNDPNNYISRDLYIGQSLSNSNDLFGFVSNFRIVKGTGLYTANFTPPTEPLTAITNTILLCANSTTSATASTVAPSTISAIGSPIATRNELTGSIVLAVPGIALENTNTELVTNGDFSNGTTGWTGLSGGSLSVEGNRLKITETTNALDAYAVNSTAITTVSGTRYTIKWTFHEGTNTTFTVRFGNSGNQTQAYLSNSDSQGQFSDPGTYSFDFEATGTQLNLSFIVNQASSYGYISNVSVKEAMPVRDYSADIKGSGTNKTVTLNGTFSVGDCSSYYGSALKGSSGSRYVAVSAHSDFANLYDVDHTIEFWYKNDSWNGGYLPHNDIISNRHSTNNVAWRISFTDKNNTEDGIQLFGSNGFSSGANTLNNDWNHCAVEQQNGATTIYINGVVAGRNGNEHGYQTYKASTGPIIIGSDGRSANLGDTYSFNGQIQDVRIYKGVAKYKGGFDVPKPYTPVGIEAFRTTDDTCKNNFATWNPLLGIGRQDQLTYSDGNLKVVSGATGGFDTTSASNIAIKGKIYCEFYLADDGLGAYVGVMKYNTSLTNNGIDTSGTSDIWLVRGDNGHKANGSTSAYAGGAFSTGDIIMLAVDIANTSIWWGKNGTWFASGNPAANSNAGYTNLPSTEDLLVICGDNYSSETPTINVNFGQNPSFSGTTTAGTNADDSGKGLFKYAPPTGFLALCEDNLPTPAIADPGKHFKTVLYHGDGNNGHSITGVGFQPDLVWLKERGPGGSSHQLHDSVRGAGKALISNVTNAESYSATYLYSLDSDGFTLGTSGGINASTDTYVAWCWKAGGAAVLNSDGDLTSQVSVNQDAGFSIVKFTGQGGSSSATVGHGLGKKPAFWIYKPHANTTNWYMYHQSLGASAWVQFNTTAAVIGNAAAWGGVEPTSTVLTHGSGLVNQGSCILYAWAEIEGYSKIGSYTGNNSADGPFVYCGFKPAFIMFRNASSSGNWVMSDSSRDSSNPVFGYQVAEAAGTEERGNAIFDSLSNGFKIRNTWTSINGNTNTIIFLAFAESPFQTANAK